MRDDILTFSIGPLIPLPGLEGEYLIVSGDRVAVLSSAEARWMENDEIKKVTLPYITVKNARWSKDGKNIWSGTGKIDVEQERWEQNKLLSNLCPPPPPGEQGDSIKSTCYSEDGKVVVAVIKENNSTSSIPHHRILLFNLASELLVTEIHMEEVEDVIIVQNRVIILAPEIRVLSLTGELISKLPVTYAMPYRVSASVDRNIIAILDSNWIIRIIDTRDWTTISTWKGMFRDVVLSGDDIIALDLEGNLHAAIIKDNTLIPAGKISTGLLASQLQVNDQNKLFLMSNGKVAVHTTEYSFQ